MFELESLAKRLLAVLLLFFIVKSKRYSFVILAVTGAVIFLSTLVGTQKIWTGVLLAISLGLSLQALMLTTLGTTIVTTTDKTMSKLGI